MTRKTAFSEGWSWFKFNNLELALDMNLKFYTSVTKGFKLKVRKFWELVTTFLEVTREKLVRGPFCFSAGYNSMFLLIFFGPEYILIPFYRYNPKTSLTVLLARKFL